MRVQQQNKEKAYSKSLKNMMASSLTQRNHKPLPLRLQTERKVDHRSKQELRRCVRELIQRKSRYGHEIDNLVRELAEQERLPIELPFLQRKSSYHNYRIQSHRQHHQQQRHQNQGQEMWKKQVAQLSLIKRIRTQPKEFELSKERDKVYSIVKHYRQGSLKQMQLHLDMRQLRKWHQHNRNITERREEQAFKLNYNKKQAFHQLQLHQ